MSAQGRAASRYTYRFYPPDVVAMSLSGDVDVATGVAAVEEIVRLEKSMPDGVLLLADLRELRSISPEARREAVATSRDVHFRAVAIKGASPTMRVLSMLIIKGGRLLFGTSFDVEFFDDEGAAMRWLIARRRTVAGARG